jgi:uncharacterized protein YoxC
VSVIFFHKKHKLTDDVNGKVTYFPLAETDPDVLSALQERNSLLIGISTMIKYAFVYI